LADIGALGHQYGIYGRNSLKFQNLEKFGEINLKQIFVDIVNCVMLPSKLLNAKR